MKKKIEKILRKPNKSNYSKPKVYKIITLLKCLNKISEKIIANRLAYYASLIDIKSQQSNKLKSNLLNFD